MADEVYAMVPLSLTSAQVSHRAFRVLVALLAHANADGMCYPSNGRLAEVTRLDRRDVIRCLKELETAGLIAPEHSGKRRWIKVLGGGNTPLPDKRKGGGNTPLPSGNTPLSDTRQGSGKSPTLIVANLPPPSGKSPTPWEQTIEQTIEQGGGARAGGGNTPLPEEDIAGRLTAEVFGQTDDAGGPDWNVAAMIGHALRGTSYSERTLFAHAHRAMATARRKPAHLYFLDMLTWGLDEIPEGPSTTTANGHAEAPRRETVAERRRREIREQAEREKARRAALAAQEDAHACR